MTLTKSNQTSINSVIPQPLVYTLQTTQMLKILTKLLPGYEWKSNWLHDNVRKNGSFSFERGITLSYKGQSLGAGREHEWEIKVDSEWAEKLSCAYKQITALVVGNAYQKKVQALPNKLDESYYSSFNGTYTWNNLFFRSPAEINVAKALESKGLLFFLNPKCRIKNRLGITETKEVDFLVFHKGTARILEVDGKEHHQHPEEDYKRDRMFDKHGIRSTRFSASECLNNPNEVVQEFLELF